MSGRVSSLIDTWIVVRELEEDVGKRRVRGLYIVKSRGMGHSSDVHKLILSDDGIALVPVDPTSVPVGSSAQGTAHKSKANRNISERDKMSQK